MNYIKIMLLFFAAIGMMTIGITYIQRLQISKEKILLKKIRYLFPVTKIYRIFYIMSLLIGFILSCFLIYVYPDKNIFIQKVRIVGLYGILCPIAVIDYQTHTIPNKLLLRTAVIWVISVMVELIKNPTLVFDDVKDSVIAAMVIFIVCILCKLLIKNGIGMGDIKLFMVMGLFQGSTGASGAIFMSMIVAFFGAVGMLILKKKNRKDNICFGPFILIGTTLSMFLSGV